MNKITQRDATTFIKNLEQCGGLWGKGEDVLNMFYFFQKELKAVSEAVHNDKNITIEVEGGCVAEVRGLPKGWTYTLDDQDGENEDEFNCEICNKSFTQQSFEKETGCILEDAYTCATCWKEQEEEPKLTPLQYQEKEAAKYHWIDEVNRTGYTKLFGQDRAARHIIHRICGERFWDHNTLNRETGEIEIDAPPGSLPFHCQ